ncbi:MAG: hypothetical protein KBA66_09245 [Leptospiraceae bacterium]|nr:hypothetical protein [Leptospiraceae bacterium]
MQTLSKSQLIKCLFISLLVTHAVVDNSVYAESLRLTSGQIIEGKIISESEKVIVVQTTRGTFTIKKSDILEMERPGAKDTIAKPPAEEKLSIGKIIGMSFIPAYSPAYKSKDRPEFGIPFAMASLYYFTRFLQFQTNSRAVGYLNSLEGKSFGLPIAFIYGPSIVMSATGSNVLNEFELWGGNVFPVNLSIYINARSYFYDKSPDRVVAGKVMTEEEYLNKTRSLLQNYVAVSVLNAITTYFILNSESAIGVVRTEHNGVNTIFYAFPTGEGATFGSVSKF